jgi:hypothetical protein
MSGAGVPPKRAQAILGPLEAGNTALKGLLAEEYTIPGIAVERYREIEAVRGFLECSDTLLGGHGGPTPLGFE